MAAVHLELSAFATIYHHQVAPHIEHLARWQVLQSRGGRATTQYVQF